MFLTKYKTNKLMISRPFKRARTFLNVALETHFLALDTISATLRAAHTHTHTAVKATLTTTSVVI